MKLSEAIARVEKITADCKDLQAGLAKLGGHAEPELMETFITRIQDSSSASIQVLISSLVYAEESLRDMLNSEVEIVDLFDPTETPEVKKKK